MPIIYLNKTDGDRKVAQAVQQLERSIELKEYEQRIVLSSDSYIRVNRKRLEDTLGEPLSDEEWRRLFAVNIGQVANYDDREFVLDEEPPGEP